MIITNNGKHPKNTSRYMRKDSPPAVVLKLRLTDVMKRKLLQQAKEHMKWSVLVLFF